MHDTNDEAEPAAIAADGQRPAWLDEATAGAAFDAAALAQQDLPAAALYVVATPIGNAADLSLRALWVLRRVDAIAAEDTRVTRPLLARFGISRPLLAAHQHNEREAGAAIVARLHAGQRVALVTDAGTPAISDPGAGIVRAVLDAGLRVVPIPGPSSATAALSAAGLLAGPVWIEGFLPTGQAARALRLKQLDALACAFVLFEAPHRIPALSRSLAAILRADRRVVVARELTKKFEHIQALCAAQLEGALSGQGARGEYVVVVDAPPVEAPGNAADPAHTAPLDETTQRWLGALAQALPPAKAAAVAARATGLPREQLYRFISGLS